MLTSILLVPSLLSGAALSQESPDKYYHGINVRNYAPGGYGWKSAVHWNQTLARIKALPFPFNAIRMYSTIEEGGRYKPLPLVFDAIKNYDLDILLGMYLEDGKGKSMAEIMGQGRFAGEFAALQEGLRHAKAVGVLEKIIGISIGNEDLYDTRLTSEQIAQMIVKVQGWLKTEFPDTCIPVGHTDTYQKLLENQDLANSADFLAANAFPYWEYKPIEQAHDQFKASMNMMDNMSEEHNIPILLGETGWPTDHQQGHAIGSVENLQQYWKDVICSKEFLERDAFFYMDEDFGYTPNNGPH